MPFSNLTSETFEALFDYASIGILITDAQGEIKMANKFIARQFAYGEDELIGLKVETLIPRRYTEKHVKHRERYSSDPHSRPMGLGMELSGLKKNGSEFPVEVSLGYYKVGAENYALAFINDITQRKETEQAVKQLNAHLEEKVKEGTQSLALTVEQLSAQIEETEKKDAELQRANTFLNNIWNHAGAIIVVCDKNGLIQFLNPAAEQALGYNANEIVSKQTVMLFHAADELAAKASELTTQLSKIIKPNFEVLQTLTELNQGNGLEIHYVRQNGSTFFVSLDITPLKDANANTTGYLCIAIDISEKKVAEEELRTALEKEKELNELKSRFVSMASHEFRTPLSAVLSSAYLVSRYTTTDEQAQRDKHIQRIVSSVSSLTEILNDFLSVGKIEEGDIHPRYSSYDIEKQMTEAVQDIKHMLKIGQYITYEHTGSNEGYFDPSMMKHIVTNLLSNAVKFSHENTQIELTTRNSSAGLVLSVKNHGIGIPETDMDNLFKRFFRSSNATNIQGTGLGLHIVSKYAELMHGKIECSSSEPEGTLFKITFDTKNIDHEDHTGN